MRGVNWPLFIVAVIMNVIKFGVQGSTKRLFLGCENYLSGIAWVLIILSSKMATLFSRFLYRGAQINLPFMVKHDPGKTKVWPTLGMAKNQYQKNCGRPTRNAPILGEIRK